MAHPKVVVLNAANRDFAKSLERKFLAHTIVLICADKEEIDDVKKAVRTWGYTKVSSWTPPSPHKFADFFTDPSNTILALDPTFCNEDDLIGLGSMVEQFAGIYSDVATDFLQDAGFVRDEEKDLWRFVGKPKPPPKTKPKAKPDADEASEEVSE